jgi:putative Ca2+/H+ antiporter (TMEM165/GDT1 family)
VSSAILDVGVAAATFAVIFPAELPDKTLVATLVLSTRLRPFPVWIGVCLAFAVQCTVAVAFGGLLHLLPRGPVLLGAGALFATGSVLMFRGAGHAAEDLAEEEREVTEQAQAHGSQRIVLTSFLVLFAAEWGDLSQLVTAGLAARYGAPFSVFVGSWLALCTVGGLAALAGRQLALRMPVAMIRRGAGVVFAVIAVVTLVEGVKALS